MKNYFYLILVCLGIFLGQTYMHQKRELQRYKNLYSKELQNVEAYRASNSGLEGKIREYQMTMDDLRTSNDSLDKKLVDVLDKLKVKDSKVEYVQYQTKVIHKTDTLNVRDTIFVPEAHVDTIIGDKWYSLAITLDYPSLIEVSPTFNSEQYVIINTSKVYDKKPSKIFFIRWFQKKHTVVEVNVEEKSPYVTNKDNKFIKILK